MKSLQYYLESRLRTKPEKELVKGKYQIKNADLTHGGVRHTKQK